MKRETIATCGILAALVLAAPGAQAEGVQVIEDFESYTDDLGSWGVSGNNNINATLGLNPTSPIAGSKDMKGTIGASLLGSSYSISNSNLNVPLPAAAETFKFKIRPLLALNLSRNVTVTLRDQNNVSYVSEPKSLGLLALGTVSDLDFDLSSFTPPVTPDAMTAVHGVELTFETSVASIATEEHIDDLRFVWDNSAVSDWMCY